MLWRVLHRCTIHVGSAARRSTVSVKGEEPCGQPVAATNVLLGMMACQAPVSVERCSSPRSLNRPTVVVAADVLHGVGSGKAVENGQAGQRRAGPPLAAAAGHLDPASRRLRRGSRPAGGSSVRAARRGRARPARRTPRRHRPLARSSNAISSTVGIVPQPGGYDVEPGGSRKRILLRSPVEPRSGRGSHRSRRRCPAIPSQNFSDPGCLVRRGCLGRAPRLATFRPSF